jgi:hypothetical protein
MFEFLKDYKSFRNSLRDVKRETFEDLKKSIEDLKKSIEEKERLEKKVLETETRFTKLEEATKKKMFDMELRHSKEIQEMKTKYDNDIIILNHSLALEKERFETEKEKLMARLDRNFEQTFKMEEFPRYANKIRQKFRTNI